MIERLDSGAGMRVAQDVGEPVDGEQVGRTRDVRPTVQRWRIALLDLEQHRDLRLPGCGVGTGHCLLQVGFRVADEYRDLYAYSCRWHGKSMAAPPTVIGNTFA